MKARELKIGNWVKYNSDGWRIGVVTSINNSTATIDKSVSVKFKNIEPIPLTEEVLLKCGFEKSKHSSEWYLLDIGRYYFEVNINTIGLINIGISDKEEIYVESIDNIKCEYLHDLQNKIFAITNQELEINL